jgi:hypothetical protein
VSDEVSKGPTPEGVFLIGIRSAFLVSLFVVLVETVAVLLVKYGVWLWHWLPF